ncbi:MAG TPA: hypothetical protein HPP83_04580 [Candidatus Hydrogenedentes bacterium]|nr:hypothetical protein [Candidatus Hydrogenedentota bacterium]
MNEKLNAKEQLSEIHRFISEARATFSGGGVVGLVWGLLTALVILIALVFRPSGGAQTAIWAAHNALGWTFTLVWFHKMSQQEGRVSLRGKFILRLWAMVTLAIWLSILVFSEFSMWREKSALCAFIALFLGMGVFGTGLLSESLFSQIVGVVLSVVAVLTAVLLPRHATLLILVLIAATPVVWALGGWHAWRRG